VGTMAADDMNSVSVEKARLVSEIGRFGSILLIRAPTRDLAVPAFESVEFG